MLPQVLLPVPIVFILPAVYFHSNIVATLVLTAVPMAAFKNENS
jgi:hypothetical protein